MQWHLVASFLSIFLTLDQQRPWIVLDHSTPPARPTTTHHDPPSPTNRQETPKIATANPSRTQRFHKGSYFRRNRLPTMPLHSQGLHTQHIILGLPIRAGERRALIQSAYLAKFARPMFAPRNNRRVKAYSFPDAVAILASLEQTRNGGGWRTGPPSTFTVAHPRSDQRGAISPYPPPTRERGRIRAPHGSTKRL